MNQGGLKVLMLSSDRNILLPGSLVAERMRDYGNLVEALHIVLLCDRSHSLKETVLASNVFVYPTNSLASIFRPLDAARLGKKLILEKKFVRGKSVITADSIECGWAGVRIKRKWRLPLEVQLHTDPFSPYFSGFQNAVRKFFAGSVLRNADRVRVVSEALKAQVSRITQAEVEVLPIYVDKQKIEDAPISFDVHARYPWHFIILAVSRLAPEKNLGLAIQVLSLVRQKFPDVGMLIVGSGPEEKSLKSKVKSLKLEGAVEFAGWQNSLSSYYKTANLFIQTSLFEGYGLSLVEAGLSGMPIVTTDVGIAQELEHGKDLYKYSPNDPQSFADGIVGLIENNFKRENLKINIRRALESRLLSKEEYLKRLAGNWESAAAKIR